MEEQWKDIIIEKNGIIYDYTGLYQVSNLGRVRSCDRVDALGREVKGKVLKCNQTKTGYLRIVLSKNGEAKLFLIHRLVAHMFIPNPNNHPIINHRDENPENNRAENLEWCTQKYNINYGTRNERAGKKISESKKRDKHPMARKVICLETKQIFGCTKDASEWCHGNVSMCCRGKNKSAGGYHWQFLDDYRREQRKQSDIKNSQLVA